MRTFSSASTSMLRLRRCRRGQDDRGNQGFWTSRAEVPAEVGQTLKLEFPVAPLPFDLQLEQSDERTVVWRTQTFPPHWVGTTVRWDAEPREGGSTVSFRHAGFSDDEERAALRIPGARS